MQVGVPYTMGVRFCQAFATLKSVAFLGSKYFHNTCGNRFNSAQSPLKYQHRVFELVLPGG